MITPFFNRRSEISTDSAAAALAGNVGARSRRGFLRLVPGAIGLAMATPVRPVLAQVLESEINVRSLGARGDGSTLDTQAIQSAIDRCAKAGGGTVCLPPGRYLSGTIFLKSRVTVRITKGAVLVGSPKLEDYPPTTPAVRSYTDNYTDRSLIYGEDVDEIALEGGGTIDGQGGLFKGGYKVRPYLIRLVNCRDVLARDLNLKDSAMWVQQYLACDRVMLERLKVFSKCNKNNDGIDIDGCHGVRIANCEISSGDDAIVLKSTLNRPCRRVVITNCILSSDCNAFKLGTESNGGFEDILFNNCTIYDTGEGGISIEMVDGGTLERVNVSNITMRNVRGPIFVRLGDRGRPFQKEMSRPGVGMLRDVILSNIQAVGSDPTGCFIGGLPGHPVENIRLSNIRLMLPGGGTAADAQRVLLEKPGAYPEYDMFGMLPAYGFYCRHARGVSLHDVEVRVANADARPALGCEDIDGLEVRGWRSPAAAENSSSIRFEGVRDALVHGCRAPAQSAPWLKVGGSASARIRLVGNDLSQVPNAIAVAADVPAGAVAREPNGGS